MDVTEEILYNHLIYGASDNTAPQGLSSSRALNYAAGPSITRPDKLNVSLIPYNLKYQGEVGLFGTENYFVKVTVNLDSNFIPKCFEEEGWQCATITFAKEEDIYYEGVVIDVSSDLTIENTYEPAFLDVGLIKRFNAYLSVDLNNLKTGNIYMDDWLDVRLYTAQREEHPYDHMYVRPNDSFYIGFHARNTRRLDYNVNVLIGDEYISELNMSDDQKRYIARLIQ